jgi:tRNA threonylcarbamoyladenosine biosynthesis protein TsaB
MRIIGIDTATTTASVALIDNGLLISEKVYPSHESRGNARGLNSKSNHAEIIIPLIDSLFETTNISLQDVTGFALSIGPGSFTGLRIGLSTVKGLAYGWQIPVVGVSTLMAYAARVIDHDGLICSLLDARKTEVYVALFQKTDDVIRRVTDDTIASAASAMELVRHFQNGAPCLFVGDGAEIYHHLLSALPGTRVLRDTTRYPSVAATVAHLAQDRFHSNDVDDLGSLTPVYVHPTEAEFKRGVLSNQLITRA